MLKIRLIALGLLLAVHPLRAEQPTGTEIVDRFIQALGGPEALEAIDSFHVTGSYDLISFNLKGTIELYFQRPDRVIFRVDLPGFGKVERGLNRDKAWSVDPQAGTRLLEGAEADQVRKIAIRGLSILPDPRAYKSVTYLETTQLNGRTVHKVRIVLKSPELDYLEFYDAESGLLVARNEKQPGPQGETEVKGLVGDYKRFGDLLIPTTWTHETPQQKWIANYESIDFSKLSAQVFALPESLRE